MKILYDPDPRTTEDIFSSTDRERFFSENEVAVYDGGNRESFYAAHLPLAEVLVSQQPMDRALLDSAPHLRSGHGETLGRDKLVWDAQSEAAHLDPCRWSSSVRERTRPPRRPS